MRRAEVDSASQNVTNLALNPRWDTSAGNNQIVRQNLAGNPRGINAYTQYGGSGGAQVITPNVDISATPIPDVPQLTRANRVSYSGVTPNNPGVQFFNGTPGTQYTFSAYVMLESLMDTPGATGFAESGVISGTTIANTVGVWQRVVWTRIPTTGNGIGIRTAAASGGSGSFLITGILIETSPVVTPYYDGSFAASGDYSYNWAGTVNNSISREFAPAPDLANSSGGAYRAAYLSTDRPAGSPKFLRLITYSPGVSVALNPTDVVIKDGVPRTDLVWLRANRNMTISMRYRNPTGSNVVSAPAATLVANQWQLYRNFQTPTGADDMALGVLSSSPQAGDMIDMGPHMTAEGNYAGDVVEGTKPFSKWLGTADRSASVGYPPQLLDLGGKPEVDISTPGTYVLTGGFTSAEPRTVYTVFTNLTDISDSTVPTILTYGSSALSDAVQNSFITLRQQTLAGPNNFLVARRTGGIGAGIAGVRPGVNIAAWGMNDNGTLFNCLNNGSVATDGTFVMNVLHEKLFIAVPSAYAAHTRTLIYRGYHDAATRAAVSRYLGNKYGALVA